MHDNRREQHGEHHGRQHHLHGQRRRDSRTLNFRKQDKAKLTARAKPQPGTHCRTTHRPEQARKAEHQRKLDDQQSRQHRQHQEQIGKNQRDIQHHAHSHKEETKQYIAEGFDIFFNLMPEFGLRNQHPRDKCAKRHRQTELLGQPGQAERHKQHIEHEKFGGLALRNEKEPFAQQALAKYKYQRQQGRSLEQGDAHGHRHLLGRLRERRDKNQQRDNRQILKQQHAHHFATVRRIKLPAFAEHLGQEGRGGHGQRAA